MEKKNVVLLTVIAVATLLITVVGATFAYFAATIDNKNNETIKLTSANDLTITYNGGTTISGSNILPGWGETYATEKSYEVDVVNSSKTSDVTYTMKWSAVTNTFDPADQKNITYTATANMGWAETTLQDEGSTAAVTPAEGQPTQFPTTDGGTFVTQTLKPGEKVTYTIKVAYKYDESNPQNSQGKSFTAKLNIADSDIRVKTHVAAD